MIVVFFCQYINRLWKRQNSFRRFFDWWRQPLCRYEKIPIDLTKSCDRLLEILVHQGVNNFKTAVSAAILFQQQSLILPVTQNFLAKSKEKVDKRFIANKDSTIYMGCNRVNDPLEKRFGLIAQFIPHTHNSHLRRGSNIAASNYVRSGSGRAEKSFKQILYPATPCHYRAFPKDG